MNNSRRCQWRPSLVLDRFDGQDSYHRFLDDTPPQLEQARDGRMVVFDPNFRFNSSTSQVLLHPAAAARSGLAVSVSFSGQSMRPMADVIAQVSGPVADGWFVPTRLLDQAYLPAADGTSICTGFAMGRTRAEAGEHVATLAALLA